MIVVADTNIIVRTIANIDDKEQTTAAFLLLARAEKIILPAIVFCEVAWVLRQSYKRSNEFIAQALRFILSTENLVTDREAVQAGLRMLDAGGDFADGAIQHTGSRLADAPTVFASFDRKAVRLLGEQGFATLVPTVEAVSESGDDS